MIRFLRDDVVPVFVGLGRGSLGEARAFFREYGIVSRVFVLPGEGKGGDLSFCRMTAAAEEVLPWALCDLAARYPVGRSLLLLPGTLRGARLLPALEEKTSRRYLPGTAGALPEGGKIRPNDGIVTGYAAGDRRVYSRTARVLSVTEDGTLPRSLVTEPLSVLGDLPGGYRGFFTLVWGEGGTAALPYLADGGFLLARSGLSAAAAIIGDRVLCEETVPRPWGEGEADFACAPLLWQSRPRAAKRAFPHGESGGTWTMAPPFCRRFPWDRA